MPRRQVRKAAARADPPPAASGHEPTARADPASGGGREPASLGGREPAALAAARVARASLLLGGLGLLSCTFVVFRLLESWHVTPHAASHRISIFGQELSYPAANAAAIVLVGLAAVGLSVTILATRGAVRELAASRRFHRHLAQRNPRPLGDALVIDDERPRAFCAGLLAPRVYVSTGALRLLDDGDLEAVLAHERQHERRRDPLRQATGRVLARALFIVPGLRELVRRQQTLAELGADEKAVNAAPANRSGLAAAMLKFSDPVASSGPTGIDSVRVDYLLGESPSWRFPLAPCLGATSIIALWVVVAILIGRAAHGTATLAPPFLSGQPCVVMLAAIPFVLGLLVAASGRRLRSVSRRP